MFEDEPKGSGCHSGGTRNSEGSCHVVTGAESWRRAAMGMPPVWGGRMRCHRGRDCSFRGKSQSKKSPKLLAWVTGGSWVCIMHRNREHLRKADLGGEEGSTWDVASL